MPSWKASIFEMIYESGEWSSPRRPSFSDTSASDIYPSFSPDGKVLYFSSSRKLPSDQSSPKGNRLSAVEKIENGWAVRQPVDSAISQGGNYSPSISKRGTLYFSYGPFPSTDWNIMMAEDAKGSNTRAIELLPPSIRMVMKMGHLSHPMKVI